MDEKVVTLCSSCGGTMAFDVKVQKLKCPNCGNEVELIDEKTTSEHSIHSYIEKKVDASEKSSKTMDCSSCGAHFEMEKNVTATTCPYCGSNIVLAKKQLNTIVPDGIKPFQIEKKQVGDIFNRWIRKRWLAPNELKNLYQQNKVMGIYLPYWTFDASMKCRYSAMGGKNRVVNYTDSQGKTQQKIVTDWYPTSGNLSSFFDDILVRASVTLQGDILGAIGRFNTHSLVSYSPGYISGFGAENYTIPFEDAYQDALGIMHYETEQMVRSKVLQSYDQVRNISMDIDYSNETYKHVLLPVYSTAYYYKGKSYNVLINGETGAISGDYPLSVIKITILVILGLIAVFIFLYFSGALDTTQSQTEMNELWAMIMFLTQV